MNFKGRKFLLLLIFSGLFGIRDSYAEDKLEALRQTLKSKTGFTAQQAGNIMALVEAADKKNLLPEILINRINEGIARKSDFQTIFKIANRKLNSLEAAKKLIDESLSKGIAAKDVKYSHQLLAELLEKGLSPGDFRAMAGLILARNMKMEELTEICGLLAGRKGKNMPAEYRREIISLAIEKKLDFKAIKYISEIAEAEFRSGYLYPEEIKDIVAEGLVKNRGAGKIRETLAETRGQESIKDRKSMEKEWSGEKGDIYDELKQRGENKGVLDGVPGK